MYDPSYYSEKRNYRGPDKSLARPGRKQDNVLSEWCEFPSAPCLAGKET